MKKALMFLMIVLSAGCGRVKEVAIDASYFKEGKKEGAAIRVSFTLSSATGRLHTTLGELGSAVAETNAKHEQARSLAREIQLEYANLVYELDPLPQGKPFIQVLAAVKPANGEKGTALEQLEQRVQFVEFGTNSSFLAFKQIFEEICRLTDKSEEWRAAQRAQMDALVASTHKVKQIIADIEALAPAVVKEASNRPKLRNPLVRLQNKGDFLTGLVAVEPKGSLQEGLFQVTRAWKRGSEHPNIKLAVPALALTPLAQDLLTEAARGN